MADLQTEAELVLSGGAGGRSNSARAGYLPVPLSCVPSAAFRDIPVYLRCAEDAAEAVRSGFMLYRGGDVAFAPEDRQRLLDSGRRFVYIRIADQDHFRTQSEDSILTTVQDPTRAISERSAIVYETSIELVNELLSEPGALVQSTRLQNVSRSVATLVLSDSRAFSHLFAAAHHDFYTATHMVNVATWMVPLGYALGIREPDELEQMCQAGLLHDVGKVFVPEELLNKRERLTAEDWGLIKRHPALGAAHLASFEKVAAWVLTAARQHHERLDGSGYPSGLRGAQIEQVSRICAVVDSFDAMTALRPFKQRTMTVSDAILALKAETPAKYDPTVIEAWIALLSGVDDRDLVVGGGPTAPEDEESNDERRRNKRFHCECPARIHVLRRQPDGSVNEAPGLQVTVHSVSRFGLGLLSPREVHLAERVRVYLHGRNWTGRVVHGQTVRCRAYKDGWFEIGVALFPVDSETFDDL